MTPTEHADSLVHTYKEVWSAEGCTSCPSFSAIQFMGAADRTRSLRPLCHLTRRPNVQIARANVFQAAMPQLSIQSCSAPSAHWFARQCSTIDSLSVGLLQGRYSNAYGAVGQCTACPQSGQAPIGSSDVNACFCPKGQSGSGGATCSNCPINTSVLAAGCWLLSMSIP